MDKKLSIALLEALKNGLHETGKDFPYRDEIIPPSKEALDMGIKSLKESIPLNDALDIVHKTAKECLDIWKENDNLDKFEMVLMISKIISERLEESIK